MEYFSIYKKFYFQFEYSPWEIHLKENGHFSLDVESTFPLSFIRSDCFTSSVNVPCLSPISTTGKFACNWNELVEVVKLGHNNLCPKRCWITHEKVNNLSTRLCCVLFVREVNSFECLFNLKGTHSGTPSLAINRYLPLTDTKCMWSFLVLNHHGHSKVTDTTAMLLKRSLIANWLTHLCLIKPCLRETVSRVGLVWTVACHKANTACMSLKGVDLFQMGSVYHHLAQLILSRNLPGSEPPDKSLS